jgi:Ca2+-binding EF-hand superfamily protein
MSDIFDLFDVENNGYVTSKDTLKILASMGRKLEPEDENEFLTIVDPRNAGRISKQNFLEGVETMFTIPQSYIPEIQEAFEFFDKDNDGRISCKEFKQLLTKISDEYKEKDVDELFKLVDLDLDGYITIDEFINSWKFQ